MFQNCQLSLDRKGHKEERGHFTLHWNIRSRKSEEERDLFCLPLDCTSLMYWTSISPETDFIKWRGY